MNIQYTYDQYKDDLHCIIKYLKQKFQEPKDIKLYCLYRGSMPLGTHISNILDCKLGIIDFQRYDGETKRPQVIKDIGNENVVIIDDLYDRGVTMDTCKEVFPESSIITIFKHKTSPINDDLFYLRENDKWIDFWWEKL